MKHFITRALNLVACFYDPALKLTMDEGKFRRQIVELAYLEGSEKILDIGCGTGTLGLMLAGALDSGHICALDVAPKMIKTAREKAQRGGKKIDYRIGNSAALPYEDNNFDIVFTNLLFHHLNSEEKDETLREIHRVLKINGRYISTEFGLFPDDFFHRILLMLTHYSGILQGLYPTELIGQNGMYIEHEINGPILWGDHQVLHRVLKKGPSLKNRLNL
jgi:ubiquinone/menaquinone biosynthesis C-methylase UbiE